MSTSVTANSRTVPPSQPANINLKDIPDLRVHRTTNAMPTSTDSIVRSQTTQFENTDSKMNGMWDVSQLWTSAAMAARFILRDARVQVTAVSQLGCLLLLPLPSTECDGGRIDPRP